MEFGFELFLPAANNPSPDPSGDVDPFSLMLLCFSPANIVTALIPSVGRIAGLCFFLALPPSSPLDDAVRLLLLLTLPEDLRVLALVDPPPPADDDV